MVLLPEERNETRPTNPHIYIIYIYIYIYIESVSPGERHKHIYMIYMTTHISIFKNAKSGTFARKNNGATGLKVCHADTT